MSIVRIAAIFLLATFALPSAVAADFSGKWTIDLRTEEERKAKAECGFASFELQQLGEKITGSHFFATTNCGRMNEGGDGTVRGIAIGNKALLVVTSGRNGAMVLGTATLKNRTLHWITSEEIRGSEYEGGDSPLILGRGILHRARRK